ncbi:hypothetical protein BGW39_001763 [Mortierella sp. 14UC]|nr:hypothetical protein BGW39_001763 [Mortierella sp. 14UC]
MARGSVDDYPQAPELASFRDHALSLSLPLKRFHFSAAKVFPDPDELEMVFSICANPKERTLSLYDLTPKVVRRLMEQTACRDLETLRLEVHAHGIGRKKELQNLRITCGYTSRDCVYRHDFSILNVCVWMFENQYVRSHI